MPAPHEWTDAQVIRLRHLHRSTSLTAQQIADDLGVTINVVLRKAAQIGMTWYGRGTKSRGYSRQRR